MLHGLLAQIPSEVFSVDKVLSNYVYVFFAAFLVALLLTPAMRIVALHFGIIDRPDRNRKMHGTPVAYLGGVAVFVAWLCGIFISQFMMLHRLEPGWPRDAYGVAHPLIPPNIVIASLMIVLLGLWDDSKGLKPWIKIVGQIVAAIVLLVGGSGLEATRPMIEPLGLRWMELLHSDTISPVFSNNLLIHSTSIVLVVAVVVGCCNASNLMDGLDGLCGGVTAIIALGFLIVATHLAMVGGGVNTNHDALRIIMALSLLGAVMGFIPYNFNPATIFMGDTGSMFLGFACATMMIELSHEQSKWFLASMVMFALPILDTSLAFVRRFTNGRPIFSADRQHIHHQMLSRGLTVRQTVMLSYVMAILFGILGTSMLFMRTRYAVALYLITFGWLIVTAYKMGMVHEIVIKSEPTSLGDQNNSAFHPDVDPSTVMEVQTEKPTINVENLSTARPNDVRQSEGSNESVRNQWYGRETA